LNGYVITYKGQPIAQAGGFRRSFRAACKNAGIPCGRGKQDGITFHDIRRTVKSNMAKAKVSKVYRDTLLGHSLKGMDKHYMVPDEDDLRRSMDQYTQWLDGQLSVDQTIDQKQKKVS
jgi:integrase